MNSGAVDRDIFEEVQPQPENVNLLGSNEESGKYDAMIQKKWWYRLLISLESLVSRQVTSPFLNYLSRSRHFLRYNIREIMKRKMGYCLGMLSCVLVVLAVTTTVTVTEQLPIIFLRIGENTRGQYDLIITSDHDVGYTVNYTNLVKSMEQDSISEDQSTLFSMISPRIMLDVSLFSHDSCKTMSNGEKLPIWDRNKMQWVYGYTEITNDEDCGDGVTRFDCPPIKCSKEDTATLVAYDHELEKEMGYGREWKHKKLKPGDCIISHDLAEDLGVEVGDSLIVQTPVIQMWTLGWLLESEYLDEEEIERDGETKLNWNYVNSMKYRNFYFPLRIIELETSFKGKNDHETYGSDVVFVDYESLYWHIGKYFDQEFSDVLPQMMTVDPFSYSREVYVNHPDRVSKLYNSNNYREVRKRVTQFTGEFLYLAGFDQFNAWYPLLDFLRTTRFIGLFLSLIINIIITILVGLSIILIYSLLMINVEERTFEMGVLRMVGLKIQGLIEMILMQSLMYSLPGIIIGLFVGQLVYLVIGLILQYYLKASVPFNISLSSVLLGISLGIAIPLVGSIIPIRKAMGKSLNESLDTRRSKTKAVKIKIVRMTDTKLSWSVIILSLGSFGFGFFIYYFFPLAMITQQFNLLLLVFFGIILMMLIGCVLLSLNLEGIIQNVLTRVIFFWEFASVRKLIMKNLIAHKTRNRKTTIMYSISLGFLIFISVSTRLEIRMYEYTNRRIFGTDLVIDLPFGREYDRDLNNYAFLVDLDEMVENEEILDDYAYVSVPISTITNFTRFYIQTIGGYWWESCDLQAMSPNFFEILDQEYLIVSDEHKDGSGSAWGVSEQLYSVRGGYGVMGGKGEFKNMGLSPTLDDNVVYVMEKPTEQFTKYTYNLIRYNSILESGAGTTFSKYDESVIESRLNDHKRGHDGFVSFPTLLKLLEYENVFTRVEGIPIRFIYLKLSDQFSRSDKLRKISKLKHKLKRSFEVNALNAYITDVNELLDRITVIDNVLSVFFYLSTVLAMTMCFFSLIANMITNVQEQSKEIGILRSIGCRRCTLRRVYVYEALIIIYTSGVIGTVIGLFIGYTLVLQQQLFTQLPLGFVVPYEIVIIVVLTGIVCGFFASICPIELLLRNTPVMIMRKFF